MKIIFTFNTKTLFVQYSTEAVQSFKVIENRKVCVIS